MRFLIRQESNLRLSGHKTDTNRFCCCKEKYFVAVLLLLIEKELRRYNPNLNESVTTRNADETFVSNKIFRAWQHPSNSVFALHTLTLLPF